MTHLSTFVLLTSVAILTLTSPSFAERRDHRSGSSNSSPEGGVTVDSPAKSKHGGGGSKKTSKTKVQPLQRVVVRAGREKSVVTVLIASRRPYRIIQIRMVQ